MNNQTTAEVLSAKPLWPAVALGLDLSAVILCAVAGYVSAGRSGKVDELKGSETIMDDTNGAAQTVDPTKKALPTPTRELLKRPAIAYPTVMLLVLSYTVYFASLFGYVYGHLQWWQSLTASTLAIYWSFTVMHDAVHMAIAPRKRWLNDLCGWMAGALLFAPFPLFRFIHLSHHRYSGDDELDPDAWAGHGPDVQLPLRWATIIHSYLYYFTRTLRLRSKSGIAEAQKQKDKILALVSLPMIPFVLSLVFGLYVLVPNDKAFTPIFCVMLPWHIALAVLAYLFDYVPHRPHKIPYKEDPFKSTNATSLFGTVDSLYWDWAMLGQQLHIVHHLWPFMPFYTYKTIWAVHGDEILEKGTRIAPIIIMGDRKRYFDEFSQKTE